MEYVYNAENRLTAVQPQTVNQGSQKTEFKYDYMGRRIEKTTSQYNSGQWTQTKQTRFVYNGWNLIREETTGQGQTTSQTSWVWGPDLSGTEQGAGGIGGLIAAIETLTGDFDNDGDVDGTDLAQLIADPTKAQLADFAPNFGKAPPSNLYFLYDANGNVGQLIDAQTGEMSAHYEYDPYGIPTYANGAKAGSNPFRFSTKYHDDETGLVYYGFRYYSPELGRWVNRDPLGEEDGGNLYGMLKNDLINFVDYLGLITVKNVKFETGSCGEHLVRWEFKLDSPAPCDGYIVQQIDYELEVKDSNNKIIETKKEKYWESWFVKKGEQLPWVNSVIGYTDQSSLGARFDKKGMAKADGKIKFFCKDKTGDLGNINRSPTWPNWHPPLLPLTWGVGNKPNTLGNKISGSLPSTNTQPWWWNDASIDPPAKRTASVDWNCCCSPKQQYSNPKANP